MKYGRATDYSAKVSQYYLLPLSKVGVKPGNTNSRLELHPGHLVLAQGAPRTTHLRNPTSP